MASDGGEIRWREMLARGRGERWRLERAERAEINATFSKYLARDVYAREHV